MERAGRHVRAHVEEVDAEVHRGTGYRDEQGRERAEARDPRDDERREDERGHPGRERVRGALPVCEHREAEPRHEAFDDGCGERRPVIRGRALQPPGRRGGRDQANGRDDAHPQAESAVDEDRDARGEDDAERHEEDPDARDELLDAPELGVERRFEGPPERAGRAGLHGRIIGHSLGRSATGPPSAS